VEIQFCPSGKVTSGILSTVFTGITDIRGFADMHIKDTLEGSMDHTEKNI
jgi:hypothetical protein